MDEAKTAKNQQLLDILACNIYQTRYQRHKSVDKLDASSDISSTLNPGCPPIRAQPKLI